MKTGYILKSSRQKFLLVVVSFSCLCVIPRPELFAAGSLEETIDCTDVRVDYADNPNLSREERLRLMDKAFYESLNKFELCQAAKKSAGNSPGQDTGNGIGGDGGQGGQSAEGTAANADQSEESAQRAQGQSADSSNQSIATSTMSGTEPQQKTSDTGSAGSTADDESTTAQTAGSQQSAESIEQSGRQSNQQTAASKGKPPEDIADADNDDTLAAQIRHAAENETDPVKKEQLWREYRKYKGLPAE
jgi:hypothetical protein